MEETRYRHYEPVFGVWHITRFLGEGSLGKVFEIRQETFGMVSTAALKIITLPRDGDETNPCGSSEGAVRQIVENILLVNKLRGSGNIVGCDNYQVIRHTGGTGWDILIQMELLTPLDRYVRQKGGLSPQETVRLGIDLCRALEMCRRHNVVHRDIKPDNIFVSEDGTFKLGDFSVAGVRSGASGRSEVRGTPSYMAPEVYRGGEGDFPADLCSLGLVLYQMLNDGRLPFLPAAPAPVNFADRENALRKRMSGAALPKPLYAEGRLARIVLKACAFDPGRRYPDPARMRQELEKICLPPEPDEVPGPRGGRNGR